MVFQINGKYEHVVGMFEEDRPVYKCNSTKLMLFFVLEKQSWVIADDVRGGSPFAFVNDSAKQPGIPRKHNPFNP
eukprot:m.41223 g.41223  ORF g.41223 m.41223 type:complete len:75 (+) comp10407_c1_seq3:2719-2943(+)